MAYTTINKSTDHFNTKLYTGNNNTAHAITGVGFQPDFTWIKARSITKDHLLFDAVRGVTNAIKTNSFQKTVFSRTCFEKNNIKVFFTFALFCF